MLHQSFHVRVPWQWPGIFIFPVARSDFLPWHCSWEACSRVHTAPAHAKVWIRDSSLCSCGWELLLGFCPHLLLPLVSLRAGPSGALCLSGRKIRTWLSFHACCPRDSFRCTWKKFKPVFLRSLNHVILISEGHSRDIHNTKGCQN